MCYHSLEEIKPEIKKMIVHALNFDSVTPDDIKDDVSLFSGENIIKIDSIDGLELVTNIQRKFNVKIDNTQAPVWSIINTVNSMAEFVYAKKSDVEKDIV
jgi:acyl carrier protein